MLLKWPFSLGSYLIGPMRRLALPAVMICWPIMKFMRRRVAKIEAGIINLSIQNGAGQAVIVYDNLASPPTYGDFLYVVLIARYLIASGIHVSFYIVDSEFRKDWIALTKAQREEFVAEQVRIAEALLDANLAKIQRISWQDCQSKVLGRPSDSVFPFFENVRHRVAIYLQCFNLLNQLLSDMEQRLRDRVLFSYKELSSKVELKSVEGPYISWHCRYSLKCQPERNTKDSDFLEIYTYLRHRFPTHSIMVMSDVTGCAHFAKLSQKHSLNCLFSKDYSQTFMGDGALILNSTFFFAVRGGGIAVIPMFSTVPYEVIIHPPNYIEGWSKEKIMSWQSEQQSFQMVKNFDPRDLC